MKWEMGEYPLIYRDEMTEYSKKPCAKVRLFDHNKPPEMVGDFFLYRYGDGIFYVDIPWRESSKYIIKSGDIIGIEVEGMMGFHTRNVVL